MSIKQMLVCVGLVIMMTTSMMPRESTGTIIAPRTYWLSDTTKGRGQYPMEYIEKNLGTPLYVKDSNGKKYPIIGFTLIYKEVGVYENAEGNPEIMTDITSIDIDSCALTTRWQAHIRERLAWGDTLLFESVKFRNGNKTYIASPLKIYMKRPNKKIN